MNWVLFLSTGRRLLYKKKYTKKQKQTKNFNLKTFPKSKTDHFMHFCKTARLSKFSLPAYLTPTWISLPHSLPTFSLSLFPNPHCSSKPRRRTHCCAGSGVEWVAAQAQFVSWASLSVMPPPEAGTVRVPKWGTWVGAVAASPAGPPELHFQEGYVLRAANQEEISSWASCHHCLAGLGLLARFYKRRKHHSSSPSWERDQWIL